MSMHGGAPGGQTGRYGKARTRIASADESAQRAENADAPKIPHLFRRISELFAPHKAALVTTVVLVLIGAALSVIPPLLTQRAFDDGLFPVGPDGDVTGPNLQVLVAIVGAMIARLRRLRPPRRVADLPHRHHRQQGHGRPARPPLHPPAVDGAQLLHPHEDRASSSRACRTTWAACASVLTNTVSSVLGNTVTVISAFVAMLILSWQLTIIALVLLPFMVIAQRRVGQVRARIAGKTQESLSEMTAITQETLSVSGILLSKSFTRQRSEIDRYADENQNQIRLQVKQQMTGQWFFAMVGIFMSAIPAIVYLVSGWLIAGGTADVTAGTIVAFTTVQARLLFPLMGLMRVALDLQTSSALFARIFEYLDLKPSITDAPAARDVATGPALGRVEFDDVTFRYPDADDETRPTLDGVSFTIEPGQYAAFVGPSGAGKTTVSYLVPRLYEASDGTVRFAGDDVRDLRQESLISHIGIVSQETYLFHASIGENLRYAKPDATDAELEAAARAANIHETIASFPEGYDTVVGERGYRLSGGEKQRIAIARVLLKDPAVLVLDEATSALDTISERVVQQALDDAARGRTTIAIAHRLSTVVSADVIFVIVAGRVVEQGTHAELVVSEGVYASLYRQQEERPVFEN